MTEANCAPGSNVDARIATEIHHAIERSLGSRVSSPGTTSRRLEEALKGRLASAWKSATKRPSFGVFFAAGVGLTLADLFGVGEVVIGIAFGYAAYQVLHKGVPLDKAIEEMERMMK